MRATDVLRDEPLFARGKHIVLARRLAADAER